MRFISSRLVPPPSPGLPPAAGPAEVLDDSVSRVGYAVYLLPLGPADVAEPNFVGARPHREAEGVAQPVGDDAPLVGTVAAVERVVRQRLTSCGVHPQDRSVEGDWVSAGARVLAAQRPSLCLRSL